MTIKFITPLILVGVIACRQTSTSTATPAPASPPAATPAPASPPAAEGRTVVTVDAQGYHPATVTLPAGHPAILVFTRTSDEGCGRQVVFPTLNLRRDLPLNQPVEVALTPAFGTTPFACEMNMVRGSIVAQ